MWPPSQPSTAASFEIKPFDDQTPPLDPSLFELGDQLWLSHCVDGPMPRSTAKELKRISRKELCPWEMGWEEAARLLGLRQEGRLGSILSFHHSEVGLDRLKAIQALGQKKKISTSLREGYLRLAFHGWHSIEDIERIQRWMCSLR